MLQKCVDSRNTFKFEVDSEEVEHPFCTNCKYYTNGVQNVMKGQNNFKDTCGKKIPLVKFLKPLK